MKKAFIGLAILLAIYYSPDFNWMYGDNSPCQNGYQSAGSQVYCK